MLNLIGVFALKLKCFIRFSLYYRDQKGANSEVSIICCLTQPLKQHDQNIE